MRLPLLGRLGALEWPVLIFSLLLVVAEYCLSIITSLLPSFIISFFDALTYSLFRLIPTSGINRVTANPELDERVSKVASADGFVDMCKLYGYQAEEHIVKTSDGYLLGIHRIGGPKNSNWRNCSSPFPKPVIYLHHGLLMNSEIWVANVDPKRCLPFVLADMGYDVWLGNNRGNKYSKKHVTYSPSSTAFWNFSIDDFALYDIPDTINYILYIVNQQNLVYIGFSQGSAQAFATLSINPELNKKVRLFIALAPAMAPPGLQNSVVDSLMRASPSLIYLFFGRKAILKSATYWQSIMYPPLFVHTIDKSISSLFSWESKNITYAQKLAAYPHLYSYSSVKSVVHWFQIIRSGRFHMYDDDVESPFSQGKKYFYRVASFPTQNIASPILLLYGKSDSLVDINVMLSELPKGTASIGFDSYEHLDMIWGEHVDQLIFPYIFSALKYNNHLPVSLAGANAFDKLSQLYGPLPKVDLPTPRPFSGDASNHSGPSALQFYNNQRYNQQALPQTMPNRDLSVTSDRLLKYVNTSSRFEYPNSSDRLSIPEEPQDDDDRSSVNTTNFISRTEMLQSSTSNNYGHLSSATGHSSTCGNNSDTHHRLRPYINGYDNKSASSASSTVSSTVDEIQAYDKLARKLSSSFSNTGINFGSSQPIVEVIRSDQSNDN